MTEAEYVISKFHSHFSQMKDRRIILHGTREYALRILESYRNEYGFIGAATLEETDAVTFGGIPLLSEEEMWAASPDLILLTERVKYEEAAWQKLQDQCRSRGVSLFNMYGNDLIRMHEEAEDYQVLTTNTVRRWQSRLPAYDLVVFEAVDTVLEQKEDSLKIRPLFRELIGWMEAQGIRMAFSLRKSCPEELQKEALKAVFREAEPAVFPDDNAKNEKAFLIRRTGEDLSFRLLREAFPKERMLYIGSGLINEYLLPRNYEMDAWRFRDQYDCLAPVFERERPDHGHEDIRERRRHLMEECRAEILACDAVSFDVFDTLVSRKLLVPEDLFELLEMRLKEKGCAAEGFAAARRKAQNAAPARTIGQIYQTVRGILHWTEEDTAKAREAEFELEKELLYRREDAVSLMEFARDAGKTVFLTSDMYYSGAEIADLLAHLGISGRDKILVSCDAGKEKLSGLFEVLKESAGTGKTVVHLDDNPLLQEACEKEGIRFVHFPSVSQLAAGEGWSDCFRMCRGLAERCLLGLTLANLESIRTGQGQEYRRQAFAAGVIGPLLTGYLTWLTGQLAWQSFDAVLFFARDGWLVKRCYDLIAGSTGTELPKSVYFYTSRHAAHFLKASEPESIRGIIRQAEGNGLDGPGILRNVYGLEPGELLPAEDGEDTSEYIFRHLPVLRAKERNAADGWKRRLGKLGLEGFKKCAVSDLFASGSTQKYLQEVVPFSMEGFYLGNYKAEPEPGCRISYYLQGENDTLIRNYIEVEACFTSPEPSVDSIDENGDVVFAEEWRDSISIEETGRIQDLAAEAVREFFCRFYAPGMEIDSALIGELYSLRDGRPVISGAYNDLIKKEIGGKVWR